MFLLLHIEEIQGWFSPETDHNSLVCGSKTFIYPFIYTQLITSAMDGESQEKGETKESPSNTHNISN